MAPKYEGTIDELVRDIEELLATLPPGAIGPGTEKNYEEEFARMRRSWNLDPLRARDAKSTYYRRRAALHHCSRQRLAEARDRLTIGDGEWIQLPGEDWVQDAYELVETLRPALERDPAQQHDRERLEAGCQSRWRGSVKPSASRKARSKQAVLTLLPPDWPDLLMSAAPSDWKYRDALAVSLLKGTRTAELVRGDRNGGYSPGVTVRASADHERISISVNGVKCRPGRAGQTRRITEFEVAGSGLAAAHLLARCIEMGGELVVWVASADAFRKAFERLARRTFPWLKVSITPYVARHDAIADCKLTYGAGEMPPSFAGQRSVETPAKYAGPHLARGRRKFVHIWAAEPIRPSRRLTRAIALGQQRRAKGVHAQPDDVPSPAPAPEPDDE